VSTPARGRRPGSNTTRADILAAARALFARQGYERASMRAIARRARVDPALIVHFFGTKEGLLREALTLPVDPNRVIGEAVADAPAEHLGESLVRGVVTTWDSPAVNPVMVSLFRTAVSHDMAATFLRETLQRTVIATVSGLVDDDTAQRRAELVAAQMAGLALSRYLVRLPAVVAMSPEELARSVGPSIQHYLTGPLA
jgi:AcrR family transcriptional regulator